MSENLVVGLHKFHCILTENTTETWVKLRNNTVIVTLHITATAKSSVCFFCFCFLSKNTIEYKCEVFLKVDQKSNRIKTKNETSSQMWLIVFFVKFKLFLFRNSKFLVYADKTYQYFCEKIFVCFFVVQHGCIRKWKNLKKYILSDTNILTVNRIVY